MFKPYLMFLLSVTLLLPTTATSLDAFGLTPYVIGDFVPAWENAPPQAWPVNLWGGGGNFDGFTAEDATTCQAAAAFWLRTERFAPGQSLYVQMGSADVLHFAWEEYEGCTLFVVSRALTLGIEKVVLVASPPNFMWAEFPQPHNSINTLLKSMSDIDQEICAASEDVWCVPVFDLLNGPQFYQPDGMHLNAEGHQTVADAYVTYVPEPSSSTLLVAGLLLLPVLRRASRRSD